jgi:hypothetical protein
MWALRLRVDDEYILQWKSPQAFVTTPCHMPKRDTGLKCRSGRVHISVTRTRFA